MGFGQELPDERLAYLSENVALGELEESLEFNLISQEFPALISSCMKRQRLMGREDFKRCGMLRCGFDVDVLCFIALSIANILSNGMDQYLVFETQTIPNQ